MTDDRFKTGGAFAVLSDEPGNLAATLAGRTLSGYRVGRVLGRGGMGTVLLGTRAEGDFEREVAIKVVAGNLDTSEVAQRFKTEVQILAQLAHPSIAHLLDAGVTDEGWSYLVMDYVDGQPIDEYCANQSLSLDRRVELLVDVVRAVRFAHARLIVHRDIKPSNVLVDGNGRVRLLDFGIAKLLEPGTPQHTVAHHPMTPQYASPEQLLGSNITIGSDVFQLGVLFLSVLTGLTPEKSSTLQSAIRAAAAGDDTDIPAAAARQLPADVLAIIRRCIHHDPDDRYPDTNALLSDLIRYQQGFPVLARQGTAAYWARKFIERNLPATMTAGVAAILLIGTATYYTQSLASARDLAERRAMTSIQALNTMSTMITETYSELIGGRDTTGTDANSVASEPLRLVLERTDGLIAAMATDDSEIRGELLLLQGRINRELGNVDVADRQLRAAQDLLASAENERGEVAALQERAKLALMRKDLDAGGPLVEATLAALENADIEPVLAAEILSTAANLVTLRGDHETALSYSKRAVDLLESQPGEPPAVLGRAYIETGTTYARLSNRDMTRLWHQKAVDLFLAIEGPKYRGLGRAYSGVAYSYILEGNYDKALQYFQKELDVDIANYGEQHIKTATGLNNVAIAYRRLGKIDLAIDSLIRAESIVLTTMGDDSRELLNVYSNLGNAYRDDGQVALALDIFDKAVQIAASKTPGTRVHAGLLNNYGDLLAAIGRLDEGIAKTREAIQVKTSLFGADNISTARSKLVLVRALLQKGTIDEVAELIADANAVYIAAYGAGHTKMAYWHLMDGLHASALGDIDRARAALDEAYRLRVEEYGDANVGVVSVTLPRANAELAANDVSAAAHWLDLSKATAVDLRSSDAYKLEYELIALEVAAAGGDDAHVARSVTELRRAVVQYYPDRTDWRQRLAALPREALVE
ncbi:MAG: serine/threonine-protein kinase [Pseudomonadota bacterium]